MGKRARNKKLAKLAGIKAEKVMIEARKKEQLTPKIHTAKKVSAALIATIFLLWLGVVVAERINQLVQKG